jgi:hypothetical protein
LGNGLATSTVRFTEPDAIKEPNIELRKAAGKEIDQSNEDVMSTSAPRVDSFESGSDVNVESSSQEANQKSETVSIDDRRRSIAVMNTQQKPIRQEWKASRPIRMAN